ncbi:MAG: NUDIX hydrolase [Chloroflexi bacterium]|nr:NUDIX hydrolase [Chloroflexota bacterium]
MTHSQHDAIYRYCVRCGGELALKLVKAGDPERLVCGSCDYIQYLNPRVASGAIVRYEEKLVLLRREIEPAYGKWVFPGGFVDRGETLEAAAMREAQEEAGVDVEIDGLVGVYSYEGSPIVIIVYAATIVGGRPQALDESLEMRLFDLESIPWADLAFPSTRDSIREYCQSFWPS